MKFEEHDIRMFIKQDGTILFAAVDICTAIDVSNSRQAVSYLDDDMVMTVTTNDSHSGKRGGAQKITLVTEAGFYSLVLRSRKPEAKVFRQWVTQTVLPSIRKTGAYTGTNQVLEDISKSANASEALVKAFVEQQPKVEFAKLVEKQDSNMTIEEVAKACNVSRSKLFAILRNTGYLMVTNNLPYQKHIDSGLFDVNISRAVSEDTTTTNAVAMMTAKGFAKLGTWISDQASVKVALKTNTSYSYVAKQHRTRKAAGEVVTSTVQQEVSRLRKAANKPMQVNG